MGCRNAIVAEMIVDLLDAPCFRASACSNVSTVELCGALKNVVALGAGFCDALGLGSSTTAAVIRRGLSEVLDFCAIMDGPGFELKTVLHSCGVADTIATSMGGRNRLCAEEFAKKLLSSQAEQYGKPSPDAIITLWGEIETRLLKGQKLQGLIATQVGLLERYLDPLIHSYTPKFTNQLPTYQPIYVPMYLPTNQPTTLRWLTTIITDLTIFVIYRDRN